MPLVSSSAVNLTNEGLKETPWHHQKVIFFGLMWTEAPNSGPPKNLGLNSAELNSGVIQIHVNAGKPETAPKAENKI